MRLYASDWLAAGVTVATGVFALALAVDYPFGEPRRMGPGFFPVILSGVMIALGLAIVLEGASETERETRAGETVNLRGLLCVSGAILGFFLLIENAGLVPAIFAAVLIGSAADSPVRPASALLLAAGLSVFCVLVFITGLALPIRPVVW